MRNEDSVVCRLKNERHRVKELTRTVPGEFVPPRFKTWLEVLGELPAHRAVSAIARHDHGRVSQSLHIVDPLTKFDLHADALACALQDVQHVDPGSAGKMVVVDLHVGALV